MRPRAKLRAAASNRTYTKNSAIRKTFNASRTHLCATNYRFAVSPPQRSPTPRNNAYETSIPPSPQRRRKRNPPGIRTGPPQDSSPLPVVTPCGMKIKPKRVDLRKVTRTRSATHSRSANAGYAGCRRSRCNRRSRSPDPSRVSRFFLFSSSIPFYDQNASIVALMLLQW